MTTQATMDYVPDEPQKKAEPAKPATESVKKQEIIQPETALAVIEIKKETALTVFTAEKGLDPYLAELEARARASIAGADVSTIAGQDIIRSVSYSVSKSKKPLETLAADLKKDAYALVDKVNTERDRGIKILDDLQKELRRPLTEWETAEKNRVDGHKARLQSILDLEVFENTAAYKNPDGSFSLKPESYHVNQRLETLDGICKDVNWQEFAESAKAAIEKVRAALSDMLVQMKKAEADAAELARLRKEQAEREQKERDERIAAEAAAKAKAESEAKAAKEASDLAAEVQREKDAAAKALLSAEKEKQDAIFAAAKAEREAEAKAAKAVQDEKDRVAAAKLAEEKAEAARAADKAHKAKINNAAVASIKALPAFTLFPDVGIQELIVAIAKGEIPNVTIKY